MIDALEQRQLMAAAAGMIDAGKTYQTIEALGAASIAWTHQKEQEQGSFYDGLVNDLGATGVRGAIMPNFEIANDNNDPNVFDWSKFDSKQLAHVLQFDQRMTERGVKSFFLTVWAPPSWMKTNKSSIGGGSLRPDMRAEFAEFLSAVVIASKRDFGVDIAGVSLQNEPFFVDNFETTTYDNIAMRETLVAVQKKFAREKLSTKVIVNEDLTLPDPSRWLWYNQAILDDDEVDRSKLIIAAHWTDPNSMYAQANQLAGTGIPLWFTEVSGKEGNWDGGVRSARDVSDSFTRAQASAYYYWTFNNYGANVPEIQQTPSLMYNGKPNQKYYALKHFYKYVRPGMQRINSTIDESSGMRLSAFRDPKTKATTIVLVNTNTGSSNNITLNLKGLGAGTANFRGWSSDGVQNWKSMSPLNGSGSTMSLTVPKYGIVTLYNGPDIAPVTGKGSPPLPIYQTMDSTITNQLRRAINVGDLNEVKRLISTGIDVNKADGSTGWTAMHAAAANNWQNAEAIFDAVLAAGGNVNAKDKDGFTPLHAAAMNQFLRYAAPTMIKANIIKKLIANGAQVDARDNAGRTPLMWAALTPANMDYNTFNTEVPKQLLASGANRLLKDNAGRTAYDYATQEYKSAFMTLVGGTNTDTFGPQTRYVAYNAKLNAVSLVITEDVDVTLDTVDLKVVNRATNATVAIKSFTDTFANGLTVARAYFNTLANGQYRLTVAAGAFTDRNGKPSSAITYDFSVGAAPSSPQVVYTPPATLRQMRHDDDSVLKSI